MPLVTTESIVLQSFAYSETSKIVRLLTRTHGVRSAIARGARRPRSQYGGLLEPFSVGMATMYLKEGRELQTLSGFELTRSGQPLGRDLLRFGAASLLAELVVRTASEEADPSLFEQVLAGLDRIELASPEALEASALAEAWALVGTLGFEPILDYCVGCERALLDEEDAVFDYIAGGVRCRDCTGVSPGKALPGHARRTLAGLAAGQTPEIERAAAHWALLSRFLAYHVIDGRPLRSLSFLAETLQREPCAG